MKIAKIEIKYLKEWYRWRLFVHLFRRSFSIRNSLIQTTVRFHSDFLSVNRVGTSLDSSIIILIIIFWMKWKIYWFYSDIYLLYFFSEIILRAVDFVLRLRSASLQTRNSFSCRFVGFFFYSQIIYNIWEKLSKKYYININIIHKQNVHKINPSCWVKITKVIELDA